MLYLEDRKRMAHLIFVLNDACKSYYDMDEENLMTNLQYDKILVELTMLEEKTGVQLPGSPSLRTDFLAGRTKPEKSSQKLQAM